MAVNFKIEQAHSQPQKRTRADSNKIIELGFDAHTDLLCDTNAEKALIATVLLNPEQAYPQVAEMVQASDFYWRQHGFIWLAIQEIERQEDQINLLTVLKHLRTQKAKEAIEVDDRYLGLLTSASPDINHAESYARIVRDFARVRRVLVATDDIRKLVLSRGAITDIDTVADRCMDYMYEATEQRLLHEDMTLLSTAHEFLDDLEARQELQQKPGFSTGHFMLDDKIGGLQPGELTIVGGTAGQGKTTWMLSVILNALKRGEGVVLFSLEMTRKEIFQALTSMLTGISKTSLKSNILNATEMAKATEAIATIAQYPLYIVDKMEYAELTPLQAKRRLKVLMRKYSIRAAFFDGIWLMHPDPIPNSRKEEITRVREIHYITMGLIKLAGEFKMPVVAMHQYTREYAKRMASSRKNKGTPTTFDFAEGSAIERNAQVLIALHRPGLFIPKELLGRYDDQTLAYVLKDRNGSVIDKQPVRFNYDDKFATYKEASGYDYPSFPSAPF